MAAWHISNLPKGDGVCEKGKKEKVFACADDKPPEPEKKSSPPSIVRQKHVLPAPAVASTEAAQSRGVDVGKASAFAERTGKYEAKAR